MKLITDDRKTEVPIEDIDRFVVYHERYQNRNKLKAYVKCELCTVISNDELDENRQPLILKKGKYSQFKIYERDIYCAGSRLGSREKISREVSNSFKIIGKFNKCRTKLMKQVLKDGERKQNKNVVMTGLNSGFTVTSNYIIYKTKEVE